MVETFLKYLSFEKRYSKHTVAAYQKDLQQFSEFLASDFEIVNLQEVLHPYIRSWVVHLMDQGLSPKTVNRKIATLKSFYKFLLAREYISVNPTTQIKPLKTEKDLPAFIKEEEITNLLDRVEFANDFAGKRDHLILELLYGTGIRLAELQGLKESDINSYEKTIRVLGKRSKERIIPISNSLIHLITDYKKSKSQMGMMGDRLLLTDKGDFLYPMFIYRKVKKYLNAVTTLSKKSPHVMRHTFATHLLNKGADLNAVKDLLGHTSLAATQVYTHNSIEKLKAAFDQAHPKA
ncbi:tyrosine-type recombinase/integrase [Ekhidna sp.]|uniref:tyrosine-type recombinase/integrase n=1 Tax=Ekhidna sp. TaxID=2608089 RepID=UPI003BA85BEE